jgi:methylase of polypeptide subunit release factors
MEDNKKVFSRNLTSELLVKTISALDIKENMHCLDLGCGDGNIILSIAKEKKLNKIFGSDISELAINEAIKSASGKNINHDFRVGTILKPWKDCYFDVISCDVAAISEKIANLSNWYDGVSCSTGISGLDLITPIIIDVKDYLKPNGYFVIPIISLANHEKLVKLLNSYFLDVDIINKKEWPMPEDLINKMKEDNISITNENWTIVEKFGLYIASTAVAVCKDKII